MYFKILETKRINYDSGNVRTVIKAQAQDIAKTEIEIGYFHCVWTDFSKRAIKGLLNQEYERSQNPEHGLKVGDII